MNETDVREDIIVPLLHRLGYEQGSKNNIKREQYLTIRYPKEYLGRKNPNTDPILRGYADYILEVEDKVRWVVEAKSPANAITEDDVEQAYTYAKHPEVAAVLYCLCDGQELRIYKTDLIPKEGLICSFLYEEFEEKFDVISNILAPANLFRNWGSYSIDLGKPLSANLHSTARISGGFYRYIKVSIPDPVLPELTFQVINGAVSRDEDGNLIGIINTRSPLASAQRLSEKIGTDKIDFISKESTLSTDSKNPTIFSSSSTFILPQGERIINYIVPKSIVFVTHTVLRGYLDGQIFKGTFDVSWRASVPEASMNTNGVFEIYLI